LDAIATEFHAIAWVCFERASGIPCRAEVSAGIRFAAMSWNVDGFENFSRGNAVE